MKIGQIEELTGGKLLNRPLVSSINRSTAYLSKLTHGDLFLSNNNDEIQKAIERGAHCIVFDSQYVEICDKEIAWIRCEDISVCAMRLLRFALSESDVEFFYMKSQTLHILKSIVAHRNSFVILQDDWRRAFEQLKHINRATIITTDAQTAQTLCPDFQTIDRQQRGYVVHDTLFRSTIRVDKFVYQDLQMPPFYLAYLLEAISFCKNKEIAYEISKISYTKMFLPIFLDANLFAVAFGKSNKVAIFVQNIEDICASIEYLRFNSKATKSIVIAHHGVDAKEFDAKVIFYNLQDEILGLLKDLEFNYAFILGASSSIFEKRAKQLRLFDA